jgi:manganese/zinc/iron transport system permease protein
MPDIFRDLFSDYTLRTVALGAAALGIVSGALGSYAVLRRRALLGDAISHAALPGIALAFMLTGSKAPLVLVFGAAAAGWVGTLALMAIVGYSRIKEDAALGLVLSVFFGAGLVLLTFIQKQPTASQAGLDRFLFGQAATLVVSDVILIASLGAVAIGASLLFWKEFKLLCFDPAFAQSMGFRVRTLDIVQTSLLVLSIVLGLQTVGVVLMSAMVVAPAAAARQWTNQLSVMMLLAALFGAVAGVSGAVLSATTPGLPTGPTIVLCLTAIVVISLLAAPGRGVLWRAVFYARGRAEIRIESVLLDMLELSRQHDEGDHAHDVGAIDAMSLDHGGARRTLLELKRRGMVTDDERGRWLLTAAGRAEAAASEKSRATTGVETG